MFSVKSNTSSPVAGLMMESLCSEVNLGGKKPFKVKTSMQPFKKHRVIVFGQVGYNRNGVSGIARVLKS